MSTTVDLFFAGLMLICLDGQSRCTGEPGPNTAWVVKADGRSKPCGWNDRTITTLELQFDKDELSYNEHGEWPRKHCDGDAEDPSKITCRPLEGKDICAYPGPELQEWRLEHSLRWLARIDEVDRRFLALDARRLTHLEYVPTRIHFPTGVIGAGERWPPRSTYEDDPRLWHRSDGRIRGALPRNLSDRLRVSYQGNTLTLAYCGGGQVLIVLVRNPEAEQAQAILRNSADVLSADRRGRFENLSYLLWYYRLGRWRTVSGSCPQYEEDNRDAILLRCRGTRNERCSCIDECDRDSVFWPPELADQIVD